MVATVANATQAPHGPWFRIGVVQSLPSTDRQSRAGANCTASYARASSSLEIRSSSPGGTTTPRCWSCSSSGSFERAVSPGTQSASSCEEICLFKYDGVSFGISAHLPGLGARPREARAKTAWDNADAGRAHSGSYPSTTSRVVASTRPASLRAPRGGESTPAVATGSTTFAIYFRYVVESQLLVRFRWR